VVAELHVLGLALLPAGRRERDRAAVVGHERVERRLDDAHVALRAEQDRGGQHPGRVVSGAAAPGKRGAS
jgi:hypothetical protein